MYIHEHPQWPDFTFDSKKVFRLLEVCHIEQGRLLAQMQLLTPEEKQDRVLETIASDIIESSGIEGISLNKDQVRSSVAHRLGIQRSGLIASDHNIDSIVEMMLDATRNYDEPLDEERLLGWHACLFPTGYSGMFKIDVGKFRSNPMQVVSGSMGKEKIHYEAPDADKVAEEMSLFLEWVNTSSEDTYIKAAIAHLWFVAIHPFDDGNGRIARTISDMFLCRSDRSQLRFYSLSSEILREKQSYYEILEKTEKGNLDITEWIIWFLNCILHAIEASMESTSYVFRKYTFRRSIEALSLNERQLHVLDKLTDKDWVGRLNSSKWAKIAKCSTDTALRDITDLISKGILVKEESGGRSTNYILRDGWN